MAEDHLRLRTVENSMRLDRCSTRVYIIVRWKGSGEDDGKRNAV